MPTNRRVVRKRDLHLLKVNYPMNDESTLRDVECFFFGLIDKNFGFKYNFFGFGGQNYGLQTNKKTGKRNT